MAGTEFAHLHPSPDLSLHTVLPPELAAEAIEAAWAEPHPIARLGLIPAAVVMLYAPSRRPNWTSWPASSPAPTPSSHPDLQPDAWGADRAPTATGRETSPVS